VQIDGALEHLVDRRQHGRQRLQVRLLDQIGGLRRHAEGALLLAVGEVSCCISSPGAK
jgi:hypothetical protein